jgi:quercetin dioxygenase-like cupin family protein/DNA-binding XRE family transcriptional regulator
VKDDKLDLSRDDFIAAADAFALSGEGPVDATGIVAGEAEQAVLLGERIRMAREWKGFTLDEVALNTGIEKQLLARAESGEAMLPLGTLVKVAKFLSLRLADVISRGREPYTIVRAGEGRALQRSGSLTDGFGYSYRSLAPNKKGKAMEPFLVTLYPKENLAASAHEGQEFLFVLEGEVEVVLGKRTHHLTTGDAIYYDSIDAHLVTAHGDLPAKILAVLSA